MEFLTSKMPLPVFEAAICPIQLNFLLQMSSQSKYPFWDINPGIVSHTRDMIIGFVALFGLLQKLCLLPVSYIQCIVLIILQKDCSLMSSACVHSHLKSPGLSQSQAGPSQGPGGRAWLQFRKAQAPAHWAKAGPHRPKPGLHITKS